MDRRMAIIAHGQVDQAKRCRHIAHQAASHSKAAIANAAAMRRGELMARSVVPGEMDSGMASVYQRILL